MYLLKPCPVMKNILFTPLLLLTCCRLCAQDIDKIINPAAVEGIEKVLSADNMRGRASFSPDIERAADYIETQFKAAGLQTWNGSASYRQPFSLIRTKVTSASGNFDNTPLPAGTIAVF